MKFYWDDEQGWVQNPPRKEAAGPYIMGDIEPYWSPLSFEMVTSRSQRRREIREHNVNEVGNEKLGGRAPPEPRRTR